MTVTTELMRALNQAQVVAALSAQIKRTTGWEVSRVVFEGSKMSIFNFALEGHHDGNVRAEHLLLVADTGTGKVSYGRLGIHGLGPVDLTIIGNVMAPPAFTA